MNLKLCFFLVINTLALNAYCQKTRDISKKEGIDVEVPANSSAETVMKLSTMVRPSYRQLDYQKREMLGFIHFGLNTFTHKEWSEGKDSPLIFNPKKLDATQWVQTFKDAGLTAVILVAKHHDGFCLWPSAYTEYSVKNSPWRNGKGDLVKEVADACKKLNMKLAIYLSPWDRHETTYGTDAYNDYYIKQMNELFSNYGPVYLLWLDGAGQNELVNGAKMPFDWDRIFKAARKLQPDILLSGSGPDVRWVGNESGRGRETEWSVQGVSTTEKLFGGNDIGLNHTAKNLGDISNLINAKRLVWYPSRGGLPIRKGWFNNPADNYNLKSLNYLADSYFSTVGQNSNLLPNLSPDTTGRIPSIDSLRLVTFGKIIQKMKAINYSLGATAWAEVNQKRYNIDKGSLFDGDNATGWASESGVAQANVVIKLKSKQTFNVIKLQENISGYGQRVSNFAVDILENDKWVQVKNSTTIGFRKLLRLEEDVTTDALRIRFINSRVSLSISEVGLYRLPKILPPPIISRKKNGKIVITGPSGVDMRYTFDESVPDTSSSEYKEPFTFDGSTLIRAALINNGLIVGESAQIVGVAKVNWKVVNNPGDDKIENVIDEDPSSYWESKDENPEIVINIGQSQTLKGLLYRPLDASFASHIKRYECYVSEDGVNWGKPVAEGEIGNIANNPVEQYLYFNQKAIGRYLKLRIIASTKENIVHIAEIGAL